MSLVVPGRALHDELDTPGREPGGGEDQVVGAVGQPAQHERAVRAGLCLGPGFLDDDRARPATGASDTACSSRPRNDSPASTARCGMAPTSEYDQRGARQRRRDPQNRSSTSRLLRHRNTNAPCPGHCTREHGPHGARQLAPRHAMFGERQARGGARLGRGAATSPVGRAGRVRQARGDRRSAAWRPAPPTAAGITARAP